MSYRVKIADFMTPQIEKFICDSLNKGNQIEIKRERESVVVVEVERHVRFKIQMEVKND